MPRMPRDIAASTRKNFWKRLRWSRSEMPMPSSETRSSTTRPALAHAHGHGAAVGRVLDRVVDQVDQDLAHAVGVGVGERAARRQHERELVLLGAAAGPGGDVARDRGDVDRARAGRPTAPVSRRAALSRPSTRRLSRSASLAM